MLSVAGRTLLETTARVPLFVRDPSMPQSFGTRVPAIVENVDIFPTVAELAGLQREASDERGLLWPPLEGQRPELGDASSIHYRSS